MSFKLPQFIDLHGLPIQNGFNKTLMFIKLAHMRKRYSIKIITGRSGKMNHEFERWMEHVSIKNYVKKWKWVDDHGAWLVYLSYKD